MITLRPPAAEVTCLRCKAVETLASASGYADARKQLGALGWQDRARKGLAPEKWEWLCPKCVPPAPTSMGRSTL